MPLARLLLNRTRGTPKVRRLRGHVGPVMNTNRPPVVGCVVIAPVAFALVLEAERAQLHVAPARADEAAMGRSIRLLVALTALVSSSSARADEGA